MPATDFLPEFCAVRHPGDDRWVLIQRGVKGFFEWRKAHGDPETFNARMGVSDAQRGAMVHGSMFGFDTPGADPMHHLDHT